MSGVRRRGKRGVLMSGQGGKGVEVVGYKLRGCLDLELAKE